MMANLNMNGIPLVNTKMNSANATSNHMNTMMMATIIAVITSNKNQQIANSVSDLNVPLYPFQRIGNDPEGSDSVFLRVWASGVQVSDVCGTVAILIMDTRNDIFFVASISFSTHKSLGKSQLRE